jgi:hypothetical protein
MIAAENGNSATFKMLCSMGADLAAKDKVNVCYTCVLHTIILISFAYSCVTAAQR